MNEKEAFFGLRYEGKRFDRHTMPVQFAMDLIAYNDLLLETAAWLFRQKHPERKRLPKGFTEGIELHLAEIGEGSAVSKLVLWGSMVGMFAPDIKYFEEARETLLSVVAGALSNQDKKDVLPAYILQKFNKLGKNLGQDEKMEFQSPTGKTAQLTQEVRSNIVFGAGEKSIQRDVAIRCSVFELDQKERSCSVELLNGKKVRLSKIPTDHYAAFWDTHCKYSTGAKLLVTGTGIFNRSDQLEDIFIAHTEQLDPFDVATQLEEISYLPDGWYDGTGTAFNQTDLEEFRMHFDTNFDEQYPLPAIFPMPNGNIQLEWNKDNWTVSVEWGFKSKTISLFALDKATNQITEHEWNIQNADLAVQTINQLLATFQS